MPRAQLSTVLRHIGKLVSARSVEGLSDAELLQSFVRQHDEAAFTALMQRHGPLVLGVCRHVLHHEQEAEDAFQAAFLILARHAASIRKTQSVGSWLYRVAYRTATSAGVNMAKRRARESYAGSRPPAEPHAEVALREIEALLHQEVNRLPEKYRAPFVLCSLEGKTGAQAARQLGWKEGTVRARLTQARRLLEQRLVRRGVELSALLCAAALSRHAVAAAVPAALADATVRAALLFVAGNTAAAGLVSAEVAALVQAASKAMFMTKIKTAMVLLLAAGLAAAGAGVLARPGPATQPAAPSQTDSATSQDKHGEPPRLVATKQAGTDQYGDPLPPGAVARVGTVRLRHGHMISGLTFSPDGKTLASSASDHTVRLWDVATGKERGSFGVREAAANVFAPSRWVTCVAFSPSGQTIASGSSDSTVKLWRVGKDQADRIFRGHQAGNIVAVAFAPDGKWLASAGQDRTVRLWETATGNELRQWQTPQSWPTVVTFSPDGKMLAAGSGDGTVYLWEPDSGNELRQLTGHRQAVQALAFSKDGKRLASGGADGTVRVWHPATGKERRAIPGHAGGVAGLAFTPDGTILVSAGSADHRVCLWSLATGRKVREIEADEDVVSAATLSPDGKVLALAGEQAAIHLWDVTAAKELCRLHVHQGVVDVLAFSADGRSVVSGGRDRTIRRWAAATGHETGRFASYQDKAFPAALSTGGRTAAAAGPDGSGRWAIRLWDTTSGEEVHRRRVPPGGVVATALSADGRILAWTGSDRVVHLWGAGWKETRQLRGLPGGASILAFSPDGTTLATAGGDQTFRLWEVATGSEVRRWAEEPAGGITRLAFSPDDRVLASGGKDGTVRLWEVSTGKKLHQFAGHPGWVLAVAFSPDGRTVAVGGWMSVRLWEVAAGRERGELAGHQGDVLALAFSADGALLTSGGSDTTALVWDLAALAKAGGPRAGQRLSHDQEALWRALASADGRRAYAAMWALVARPKQAVPFLERHLRRGGAIDPQQVARLIADLDDDRVEVRERASDELAKMGRAAESSLRAALDRGRPSAEVRLRLTLLLAMLTGPIASGETVRALRAVEVLEHIGTPAAQRVLEQLVRRAPEARLTQEAKAALERRVK